MLKIAFLTKYPRLYKSSYWGHFEREDQTGDSEIISNRNRFVEEYNLLMPEYKKTELRFLDVQYVDHGEAYIDSFSRTYFIISLYDYDGPTGMHRMTEEKKAAIIEGYREIYPLYAKSATTLLRQFTSREELSIVMHERKKRTEVMFK